MEGRGKQTFLESWVSFKTQGMKNSSSKVEKVGNNKAERGNEKEEKEEKYPERIEGTQERGRKEGGEGTSSQLKKK